MFDFVAGKVVVNIADDKLILLQHAMNIWLLLLRKIFNSFCISPLAGGSPESISSVAKNPS